MKKTASLFLLLPLLGHALLSHAESTIAIKPQQIQTLGITVAPLTASSHVKSSMLPGEVVVPIGQERVVSAPQSGLIDTLYVAAGQSVKRGQAIAHISSA
ncbi:MAG: biotin/lipoyl-binding protein, partial [Pseudomonadota bacterium]